MLDEYLCSFDLRVTVEEQGHKLKLLMQKKMKIPLEISYTVATFNIVLKQLGKIFCFYYLFCIISVRDSFTWNHKAFFFKSQQEILPSNLPIPYA